MRRGYYGVCCVCAAPGARRVEFWFDRTGNDKSLCERLNASMPGWRCTPRRWRLAGIASVLASGRSIVTDPPNARIFAHEPLRSARMDWIGRIVPGPEFIISPVARVAGDITCRKQKALGNQGTSLAAAELWILQMSQFLSEEVALVAPTRFATLGKKEQSMWSSKESNGGSTHERQVRHRRALTPSWQVIAIRAYHIWESRGCPDGTDVRDWLQAENELQAASTFRSGQREECQLREWIESDALIDEASEESFPASDPPASTHCTST